MNKVDKSGFASEWLVLFFNVGYEEASRCNEIKWLFWEGMQKKKFKAHYVFNVYEVISSRKAWQIVSIPKTTLVVVCGQLIKVILLLQIRLRS